MKGAVRNKALDLILRFFRGLHMLTNVLEAGRPVQQELTSEFISRLRNIRYTDLPSSAVTIAKHCMLDWLGLVIASSEEPSVRLLADEGQLESGHGGCTAVGFSSKFGPLWASFINGTAGHALDFDDVLGAMNGHPTVPVMPALVALTELSRVSGSAFIRSFVVGVEAEALLGGLLGTAHYEQGFHATGTVGTLGAAAAAASLLDLDERQWAVALALAGTQAAGLKSMFGTMGKPFHAGKAAFGGLLAARLAQRGYSAPLNILSDPQGFIAPHSSTAKLTASALPTLNEFAIHNILFKYSASCYLTHSTIEAARSVATKLANGTSKIKSVVLTVPRGHLAVCNIVTPCTALEGKFSLRYTAALSLFGLSTSVESFTHEMVARPELINLQKKITVQPSDKFANSFQSACEVTLSDGTLLTASGDVSVPTPISLLPRQGEKLLKKFIGLVQPVLGHRNAQKLADLVTSVETLEDVGSIMQLANCAAK